MFDLRKHNILKKKWFYLTYLGHYSPILFTGETGMVKLILQIGPGGNQQVQKDPRQDLLEMQAATVLRLIRKTICDSQKYEP
jgi:hypothetical protein